MELDRLINAIAEVLDLDKDKITADSKFVDDLGADSLDVLEIIMGIEDEFGIEIPTDQAESIVTVGDAYEKIKECTEKEIKSTINLRSACARTAFQIDKCISEKPDAPVLKGIEKWKEICIGRLSNNEFVEVKRQWLL